MNRMQYIICISLMPVKIYFDIFITDHVFNSIRLDFEVLRTVKVILRALIVTGNRKVINCSAYHSTTLVAHE